MRLYEFAGTNPMVTKLVAVSDQLKTDLSKGTQTPDMTVPDLLQYFRKFDIIVDKTDLYDMIKKLPLKNLITNIQGDKIVFKGFSGAEAPPEDQSKNIVANMAQNATKTN